MLSVAEVQAIVLNHARPLPPQSLPLGPAAVGLVLTEDVVSDLDMPPYDKALMDGYAVRSTDVSSGHGVVTVIEEITAGRTPTHPLSPGEAARIMTGTPLPLHCDAVVPWEHTRTLEAGRVQIEEAKPIRRPEHHAARPGDKSRPGGGATWRRAAAAGVWRPRHRGPLDGPGPSGARSRDPVHRGRSRRSRRGAGPGQIRNGNGAMLLAQVVRAGGVPRPLGIARDRLDSLRPLVAAGLWSPVLILSGGVSAGKLDLVPEVLQELGVTAHFHKVEMKPGKPVLFWDHQGNPGVWLAGQPGERSGLFRAVRSAGAAAVGRTCRSAAASDRGGTRRGFCLPLGSSDVSPRSTGTRSRGLARAAGAVVWFARSVWSDPGQRFHRLPGRRSSVPGRPAFSRPETRGLRACPTMGEANPSPCFWQCLLPALLTGLLLWASHFPRPGAGSAGSRVVPFLTLVRSQARPWKVYLAAWLGAFGFFVASLQWMRVADPAMYATWILLAWYCSLYFLLALWLLRLFHCRPGCRLC